MSFGNNLVNLRKQKGWSQDELADNLNLSRQAISKWENDLSMPDVDNVKKISRVFSVGIDELLNNEVPKDKAVALDIKKQDKKDKIINLIKTIILALVIIYFINVIYKFASLLVIVNGVSAYQNLNNYHYTITAYDENGLAEKEECWYKDGVSRTENTVYAGNSENVNTVCIDYNERYMYALDNNDIKTELDFGKYTEVNNFEKGGQLYINFPAILQKKNISTYILSCFNYKLSKMSISTTNENITINFSGNNVMLAKDSLMPEIFFNNIEKKIIIYNFELDSIENIEI